MALDNHLLMKIVTDIVTKESRTKVSDSDRLDLPDFKTTLKGYSLLDSETSHPLKTEVLVEMNSSGKMVYKQYVVVTAEPK